MNTETHKHTHCSNTVSASTNPKTHKHADCCKAKSESTSILRLTTWSLSWTQQVQGSVLLKTVFTKVTSHTSGAHLTCTSDQREINSEGGECRASCSLPVNSESACLPLSLTHTSTCSHSCACSIRKDRTSLSCVSFREWRRICWKLPDKTYSYVSLS